MDIQPHRGGVYEQCKLARQKAAVDILNVAIKHIQLEGLNDLPGGNSKPGLGIIC
jgi:hypothetical protein